MKSISEVEKEKSLEKIELLKKEKLLKKFLKSFLHLKYSQ